MRKVLIGLAAALVLMVGGFFVALKAIDINKYRGTIQDQAKAATGRDLTLAGKMDLKVSLTPSVVIEDVAFANAPWGTRKEMVKAKRFEAEVALLPLLSGAVQVNRLIVIEPDILIETDAKGKGNYEFDTAPKAAEPAKSAEAKGGKSELPNIQVEEIRIEKANFVYRDGVAKKDTKLVLDKLLIKGKSLRDPLDIDMAGSVDGKAFTLAGSVGSLAELQAPSKPWPVKLTAKAGGAIVTLDGGIAKPLAGQGIAVALGVDVKDWEEVAKAAGADIPKLPPLSLTAKASDPKGGYALDDIKLALGKNSLTGNAAVALGGARPKISGKLASQLIDLTEFASSGDKKTEAPKAAGKSDAAASGGGAKKVFPNDPLPLDGLKAVDADLELSIAKLVLPNKMPIEAILAHVVLTGGKLDLRPFNLNAGGGSLETVVGLDGSSGKNALLSAKLVGKQIEIGQLLAGAGQGDLFSGGKTDVAIDLRGGGGTVAALMGSLNGDIDIQVGEGKIHNSLINLTADVLNQLMDMINPMAKKEPFTPFKCAVVKAPIKDGVLTSNKGIAVESLKIDVVSSGTANFKTEALDLGIRPNVKDGVGLGAAKLASVVKLGGTFAEPSVGVDALEAAKTAASLGTAIATGGLSLLAGGLADKAMADSNPCMTALGKAPPKQQSQQQSGSGAKQQPAKKDESIGGAIKGLFGK